MIDGARPIEKLARRLAEVAPDLEVGRRQSRRIEGQFDDGAEVRKFAAVHLLLERGNDPEAPAILKTLNAIIKFQRREDRGDYAMHVRIFPLVKPTTGGGAEKVRVRVAYTASGQGLLRYVKDALANQVPEEAARRSPVAIRPDRDDLVVLVTQSLATPIEPEVGEFVHHANRRRVLRVGLAEEAFLTGPGPVLLEGVQP